MTMAATFADLLSVDSGNRNVIRLAWDRLHRLPGGKVIFSKMIGRAAPYTGTIDARVVELSERRSRVLLADRPEVRNHLRCVHAIALVNLAEVAGNVAVAYALPGDARFIVAGLSIEYLKKARGTIEAITEIELEATNERREIAVPVSMRTVRGGSGTITRRPSTIAVSSARARMLFLRAALASTLFFHWRCLPPCCATRSRASSARKR